MVTITGNRNKFQFNIAGYEFPARGQSEYDDNWLLVNISVEKDSLHWEQTDPSLLTWELQELAEWFFALSENKDPEYKEPGFVEPNLLFRYNKTDEGYEVIIRFSIEMLPPGWDKSKECSITFILHNDELKRIAREFKEEVAGFPYRQLP